MDIRKLPEVNPRVETGPTQFGDDWPGLFIRGDNAFGYAMHLREVLKLVDGFSADVLEGLLEELESCEVKGQK